MTDNRDRDPEHRRLFELAFGKRPAEELYDLRSGPGQLANVAGDPGYADARDELSEALMDALAASGDARFLGEGARFDNYPYYGGTPLVHGPKGPAPGC